ncbi:U3 small nucleolar RNA-associated protein 18 homolog [Ambystoma mexicanum]|uniref:U3 small nucleolar RNA-associated protein 18 homolog n=1 Tax=Ambystoma mexicanum TaxID=8296 RepID=UPI0037E8A98A
MLEKAVAAMGDTGAVKKKRSGQGDSGEAPVKIRRKKLRRGPSPIGAIERCLEQAVFGDPEDVLGALRSGSASHSAEQDDIAVSDEGDHASEESDNEGAPHRTRRRTVGGRQPAWQDEDEADAAPVDLRHRFRRELVRGAGEHTLPRAQLQARLCSSFTKAMGGTPAWAEQGPAGETDEDGLDMGTGQLLRAPYTLAPGPLHIKSCPPANQARPSAVRLNSVHFHPSAAVLLAAGLDRSLGLFQVDGGAGGLIQSLHLEAFPVFRARFTPDGRQVVATGERSRNIYVYDMMGGGLSPWQPRGLSERWLRAFEVSPDGKLLLLPGASGYLHLLSMRTKELIGSIKVNGRVVGAVFSPDSSRLTCSDEEGSVYVWDVGSRRCLHRFADEGCLRATCLAASADGRHLACGSSSGVVNLYSQEDFLRHSQPRPLKALMNLTTSASTLAFNPTGEILAMASNAMDEAVRLVHVPTLTVFPNFPLFRRKNIHLAQCMDFSPGSGFFAVANNKGNALLYRLKHYSSF